MIDVKNIEVFNIDSAMRGMRNPMNSHGYSDTKNNIIGPNDLGLAQRLIISGPDHAKFLRMIFVSMDITAPWYWYKEHDTYKIGTTSNSASSMHKILSKPIVLEDFSIDDATNPLIGMLMSYLENQRLKSIATKNKDDWKHLIQMLPSSFNQLRTWTANYNVLRNIYFARKNHKLQEWRDFCKVIETLPYAEELICYVKEG